MAASKKSMMPMIIGLVVLAIAGYFGYKYYQKKKAEKLGKEPVPGTVADAAPASKILKGAKAFAAVAAMPGLEVPVFGTTPGLFADKKQTNGLIKIPYAPAKEPARRPPPRPKTRDSFGIKPGPFQ